MSAASATNQTDDTRARILRAAGPVFARKGFQQATVREICQVAEVNLAAINYYFGDKERLYIESVKLAHQIRVEQVPLRPWPEGMPPATKLRQFVENLLTRMIGLEEEPWQARLMLREILQPTAACRELVEDFFRPQFERLLGILAEVLPAQTPRHRLQQIGFSIVGQCIYYRVAGDIVSLLVPEPQRGEHFSVPQLADHIVQFSLAALGLSPALGQRVLRENPERQTAMFRES
jgi:AcrR family transcriptional regulator